jgi:hypothetical protein
MSEVTFRRPVHRQVLAVLSALDRAFLAETKCYFAGGTRIVLELGEYRESKDMDFLCSSRDGYRQLREGVSESSLGRILQAGFSLAREVRADQYGIRTFIENSGISMKFEIVREARIDVEAEDVAGIPVACLTRRHCFAEKFLANADRGLDASTLSRDIVDLAFMLDGWPQAAAQAGMAIAEAAYGDSVRRALAAVIRKMKEDRAYRHRCVEGLAVADRKTFTAGIKALATLA